jgi:hypothetical protein
MIVCVYVYVFTLSLTPHSTLIYPARFIHHIIHINARFIIYISVYSHLPQGLSHADLYTLAGVEAIRLMGGPSIGENGDLRVLEILC